jgi:hypothetical protein
MHKLLLLFGFLSVFSSCQKGAYLVQRSSGMANSPYTNSFGIMQNQNGNEVEAKLERIVRKTLIKSKWIYDSENPDFIVTIKYENQNSDIYINLLDSKNFTCIWQGKVMDLPKSSNEQQLNRMVLAALGR